jgi:hypothetical protein
MLSRQEEQQDRIETMRNDADVRRQQQQQEGTPLSAFAQEETIPRGRYSGLEGSTPRIIGQTPGVAVAYPACSPALAIQLPDEPPLGHDNPALEEPSAANSILPVEDTGPAEAPGDPGLCEHAAGPPSSDPEIGDPAQRPFEELEPFSASASAAGSSSTKDD